MRSPRMQNAFNSGARSRAVLVVDHTGVGKLCFLTDHTGSQGINLPYWYNHTFC